MHDCDKTKFECRNVSVMHLSIFLSLSAFGYIWSHPPTVIPATHKHTNTSTYFLVVLFMLNVICFMYVPAIYLLQYIWVDGCIANEHTQTLWYFKFHLAFRLLSILYNKLIQLNTLNAKCWMYFIQ